MMAKCVSLTSIMLLLLFARCSNQLDYSQNTSIGIASRIDLLNALKIALRLANPKPTQEEREAAMQFAKFLNTSDSNDYLEAFYIIRTTGVVNKFIPFLNGFIFNGDPTLSAWNACIILVKMIKTKTNPTELEALREKLKKSKLRTRLTILPNNKNVDYTKLLLSPNLFYMQPFMVDIKNNRLLTRFFEPNILPKLPALCVQNTRNTKETDAGIKETNEKETEKLLAAVLQYNPFSARITSKDNRKWSYLFWLSR